MALSANAETLRVGGTGAALGTLRLIGAQFSLLHPSITVEVLPYVGSSGAIKGVLGGALDLGLSGRPARPGEENPDLLLSPYAHTPLVIATHAANPMQSTSRNRLAAIYTGQIKRWDSGELVRIILRPAHETDNDTLRTMSPEISHALDQALARPGMRLAHTDQDAADAIENTPGAIGTSTLALVLSEKRKVGVLAIDGVVPGTDTLTTGRYPFGKTLYLVTRSRPSPSVQALVNFIRSPQGWQILRANGQVPLHP